MSNECIPASSREMAAHSLATGTDSGEIRKAIGKLSEKVYTLSEQIMFLRKDLAPVLGGLKDTNEAEKMSFPTETEVGQLIAEIITRVDDEIKIINAVRSQVSI